MFHSWHSNTSDWIFCLFLFQTAESESIKEFVLRLVFTTPNDPKEKTDFFFVHTTVKGFAVLRISVHFISFFFAVVKKNQVNDTATTETKRKLYSLRKN